MVSKIKLIVAITEDGIMAVNGNMPWHVKEDLRKFKSLTFGQVVIYGSKTWRSLPNNFLPHRSNFVISKSLSNKNVNNDSINIYNDITSAINDAQLLYPMKDIWIIGGASIYQQTLPIVDEVYITIINSHEVKSFDIDEDNVLFFPNYPRCIEELFKLDKESVTQYATYQKYKRKVINPSNSTWSDISQERTKSNKDFVPK